MPEPSAVRHGRARIRYRSVITVRWSSRLRWLGTRAALVGLLGVSLTTPLMALAPMPAFASGTVLFNQPFKNNTSDPAYPVSLPALPSSQTTTNAVCLSAAGNANGTGLHTCATNTDAAGLGTLRLTSLGSYQEGGLFGGTSVPTSQGLDVTFNSYQYGGSQADGIAFVLSAVAPTNPLPPAAIGQPGGALGYTATNSLSGLNDAYLGIGLDVFGNFSNSVYQGSGCTNPAYISTTGGRVPGQVVVRGPGNGAIGYCALSSTATALNSPPLVMHGTTRALSAVPVEVAVNPTATSFVTSSGITVAAGMYKVVFTPVGGAGTTLTGTLPSVSTSLYPSSTWLTSGGIPKQLAFGWVASTGGSNDYHEIDSVKVTTFNPVPGLNVTQTSYNGSSPAQGGPVTYTVVPGVAAGSDENSPISVTESLPVGTVPVGAFGTSWVCAAPVGRTITCTDSGTPFVNGSSLPPITLVGIVTGTAVTSALIQSTSTATASSNDADPGIATSTTAGTLPSAPSGITLSTTSSTISGGNAVTVSGSNLLGTNAIEIGTSAEQNAGTPVTLMPCLGGATTGCFTDNGDGTLTIPSMPSRTTAAAVNVTVVSDGIAGIAAYTYTSAPAAPAAPTAVAGAGSATVTWVAPAGNGSAITSYIVTPYRGGVAQTPQTFDTSTTTRTFTGLSVGASYTFTVTAVNAIGTGAAGPQSTAVVPYALPGAPTVTSATPGDTSAILTWTTPASNSSPITGYVVTPYIGAVAQAPQTFTGTGTTQTATGLTPGTVYTFKVAAQNAAGLGPASAASAAVTPNVGPALTFAAPPGGQVGVAYSDQLAVTGGTGPYTWSVSGGSLPAGLTLNAGTGLLSGTPTTAAGYPATIQVTDASAQTATKAVTIVIGAGPVVITKTADATAAAAGTTVHYTITVNNTGSGTFNGISLTDPLTDVLDDAGYNANVSATSGTAAFTSPNVTWSGNLAAGATATITYSVTVKPVGSGNGILANTVTSATLGANCASGSTDTRCQAAVTLLSLTIVKTSDVATATPGGTLHYTILVTNSGQTSYPAVTLTDSLVSVLDDATYDADVSATSGTAGFSSPNVTWTGALSPGASATITYSVKVRNPDTGDKSLTNTAVSNSPGSNCPAGGTDPRCTVTATALIPRLVISSSADVMTAVPTGVVRYTVTVTNTGQTAYTNANFTFALGGALNNATYNGDATTTTGSLNFTADGSVTWTGNLAIGASAVLTASITVNNPPLGGPTMTSSITSTTPGNNCPAGGTDPACTTTVTIQIPQLAIAVTANTTTATPGSAVTYTLTIANTGPTAYTGTTVTDQLDSVLTDATYNNDATTSTTGNPGAPGTLTYTTPDLSWTGNLAVGATATVTYSVTVKNPDPGDKNMITTITATALGNNCPAGGTDPACTSRVTVLVPALTITKTADHATIVSGGIVHYTITVTNTGQTPYTGATLTDNLSDVTDDATYNTDATATTGTVAYTAPTLTWTGDLATGATTTITYSITVHNPDTGNGTLTNTATSPTPGNNCPTNTTDTRCTVTVGVTAQSIVLTNLTSGFTLTGPPATTVTQDDAVTMTVITNSPGGYNVTVQAAGAFTAAGTSASIPAADLRVRESGTSLFTALSTTVSVATHSQPVPSAENGDPLSNDYRVAIPFVPSGTYSGTLDYIASTQ